MRGGRRAKKGMCFTCARGGGKPIKKVISEEEESVSATLLAVATKNQLPTGYRPLREVAREEGVYM